VQALVGLSHALGAKNGLTRQGGGHHQSGIQFRIPTTSLHGDLRGSEGVRSPLQRSTKIRNSGVEDVQVMAVCPRTDGDEFLRGYINQDEGRCVRQRRAGGPPYPAVVRSEKVRRLSRDGSACRVAIWLPRLLPRNVMVSAAASATDKMGSGEVRSILLPTRHRGVLGNPFQSLRLLAG